MSKLDELGGIKEARYWVQVNKDDYEDTSLDFCEALIERVEELESELSLTSERLRSYDSVLYLDGRKIALQEPPGNFAVQIDPERVGRIVEELKRLRELAEMALNEDMESQRPGGGIRWSMINDKARECYEIRRSNEKG